MKKEILVKKDKAWCQRRRRVNKQKKKKSIMLWMKDFGFGFLALFLIKYFEDKYLGTIHKIKSVIWATLPWTYLCYIFQIYSNVLHFAIQSFKFCHSFFMFHYIPFNDCPSFIFHDFVFYGKIAWQWISYAAKTFVAKMLMTKLPRTSLNAWILGDTNTQSVAHSLMSTHCFASSRSE